MCHRPTCMVAAERCSRTCYVLQPCTGPRTGLRRVACTHRAGGLTSVVWWPLWPRMHHSASYGFGHLIIHNSSHLYWEQLLNEGQGGKDTLWIVKQ